TDFTAPYVVNDPRGIEVAKGDLRIGKFGTFSVDIETDPDGGTGDYRLDITFGGFLSADRHFYHSIPVETYRTPEFKVSVERGEATPLVYGDTLVAEVIGEYMHGAPLVGGNVAWSLTRSETGFTPPGDANRDFHFGAQRSYGFGRYGLGHFRGGGAPSGTNLLSGAGALDGLGKLKIEKELLAVEPNPAAPKPDPSAPKVEPPPPAAATYSINATVTDDNRQAIAGSGSFVVHPAAVYVGLRSERTVLKEGERAELSAVLVDLDGARVTGRDIALTLVRKETTRTPVEKNGRWVFEYDTKEIEEGACPLSASSAPASCELTVGTAGTYLVRGTATDDKGNEAFSETTIYVHGKDAVVWEDNQHRIDLVPDKDKYSPGDTATILLRSPFEEARGVVIVEREGISKQVPVHLQGGSHVVEIPVDDTMIPTVTVSAMLTRGREKVTGVPSGQDLGRPAAATGRLELAVDDAAKRIVVDLTPSAERIAPGGKLNLSIKTHTAAGDATNAAVAVMVVDEGVLSLLGHETPDPLPFFHHARSNDVWMYALQASVMGQAADVIAAMAVGNDDEDVWGGLTGTEVGEAYGVGGLGLVGTGRGGGGTGVGTIGLGANKDKAKKPRPARARSPMAPPAPGAAPAAEESEKKAEGGDFARSLDPSAAMAQPVSLRDVFATTAYFNGEVLTDEHGMANVEIAMPENLTTFRIMAVAVDPDHADHFGNGETTVTVRKPIMVRPSLPRFANFGDRFEASVMVDNLTEDPQNILVGTRGLNVELSGSEEKFVEVPAGESREVRFSMAAKEVGRMRLQFAVMSNAGRDATEVTVPVHYPATAKAFADYGAIDATTQRVLEPPADALPDFGGLEVSMSSTALSGLEGAVEYLINYEYECAEQTASRILPIFALGDIIQEFPIATVSDRDKRDLLANDGIKKLLDRQNYDGGFRYWERGDSWPYLTNWVVLALLEGKRQGYKVDADALNNALNYVENFVRYGHDTRWGRYYDWTSRAFGLWLLSGEGRGKDLFEKVWGHRKDLPFYARAQMMAVAHRFGKTKVRDEIRKELDDAVVESAKAIHFIERTTEADADGLSLLMHSSVQTDAIVMMALLETAPTDTTLPKIMAGIMADRDPSLGGRWGSTHANAWALLGASRYYESVEATEPDFVARIWIDDDFGGEQSFKGRSMTTVDQTVAMKSILGAAQREVTLEKDGPGKLYYRLGLRYAPKDLKLPADDQGFEVYREYEALPDAAGKVDPEAVKRAEDGSWVVKGGTDLRVTIHVVARDRASYVVVDDALPAGFEGQNPRFLTSGARPAAASRTVSPTRWWWPWWQFDHTDLRDDRMLLFADFMPAGVYTYSYTARATTLGTFHLPPIKAEAMYEPERYGHSASSEVRVVE
ncbi:MAG: alpha-2-macroglobulin family protein, partial [Myxococcota bacterium]